MHTAKKPFLTRFFKLLAIEPEIKPVNFNVKFLLIKDGISVTKPEVFIWDEVVSSVLHLFLAEHFVLEGVLIISNG